MYISKGGSMGGMGEILPTMSTDINSTDNFLPRKLKNRKKKEKEDCPFSQ